jgi:hypothetical protein
LLLAIGTSVRCIAWKAPPGSACWRPQRQTSTNALKLPLSVYPSFVCTSMHAIGDPFIAARVRCGWVSVCQLAVYEQSPGLFFQCKHTNAAGGSRIWLRYLLFRPVEMVPPALARRMLECLVSHLRIPLVPLRMSFQLIWLRRLRQTMERLSYLRRRSSWGRRISRAVAGPAYGLPNSAFWRGAIARVYGTEQRVAQSPGTSSSKALMPPAVLEPMTDFLVAGDGSSPLAKSVNSDLYINDIVSLVD